MTELQVCMVFMCGYRLGRVVVVHKLEGYPLSRSRAFTVPDSTPNYYQLIYETYAELLTLLCENSFKATE